MKTAGTLQCPFSNATLERMPREAPEATVIICPGGGYEHISPRESKPVAAAFGQRGCEAAILNYSVRANGRSEPLGLGPLRELGWAIRTMRAENGRANALPLFVCGFSAGAHLAASLGVHWDDAEAFPDERERKTQKPDGLILCYPVITAGAYAHRGSIANLTGGDTALNEYFSLEKYVSPRTPRSFVWHTMSDESVPVQNSLLFYSALVNAGVQSELHIFPRGAHGLSIATEETQQLEKHRFADAHIASWVQLCAEWMGCAN